MSNTQTVQAIYREFGTGDIPFIVNCLSEDVDWEHDAVDHGIPWLKPDRGKAHVLKFFEIVGREFEIARFEVKGLLEGGPEVAAIITIEARIRSTGKFFKDYEVHVWTFGADGKVSAFRHVVDTRQHHKAAGR